MNEKENLTRKLKLVNMKEVDISTLEKPIIGTQALATCMGVLLYNEEHKKAIVAHSSSDWKSIAHQTLSLVFEHGLNSSVTKYKIIPGYYPEHYQVADSLEEVYRSLKPMFIPFDENEITDSSIQVDEETTSCRFAFDSLSGKFVTQYVYFGEEYLTICAEDKDSIL